MGGSAVLRVRTAKRHGGDTSVAKRGSNGWTSPRSAHASSMPPTVATQISRHMLNRLCSIKVSNFMTVLLQRGNEAFSWYVASTVPTAACRRKPHSRVVFRECAEAVVRPRTLAADNGRGADTAASAAATHATKNP